MNKTSLAKISIAVIVATPLIVSADHAQPSVEVPLESGGFYKSKSFKTNGFIYRSIGGNTVVKGKKKKRKWTCLWLCKKNVDKKAESITITNQYYSELSSGVFASTVPTSRTCPNASSCTLKEWAFGFNIDMEFPDGGNGGGLLPIDGVGTTHSMIIDGEPFSAFTAKGKHPIPDGPIVQ